MKTGWIENHIIHCSRCRRRITGYSRMEIAFSLLKTQPHSMELLKNANNQAIRMLKRSLREIPQARSLKQVMPKPHWFHRCLGYSHSLGNAAACFTILILIKLGIFNSMNHIQNEGEKAYKYYYTYQMGEDSSIANDLFES
ncbi:MAG: hypothetical protein JW860_14625 [Sedimentisphaerales bacterium]|nr:hypothetical protein [Sedimentisphaerales bacterium]